MSYADGWAALNLEMPARVPRTEYSVAEYHFPLIERVTGIRVCEASTPEEKLRARQAMRRAWNFDLQWSTLIHNQIFGDFRTRMGHAEYAADGADLRRETFCPFATPEEALAFDPMAQYGRADRRATRRAFEAHYRNSAAAFPDEVNMTGVYVTLMSGLIEIFGWNMLLEACATDQAAFGALTNRYADFIMPYMEALAESDVPCVMIHDDMVWTSGAFIQPAWYRRYIFPNYKRFFAPILESGKKLLFTSDGTYTEFIDDLVATGVQAFVMEPTTDIKYIAEKYGRTHAFIGGPDVRVLTWGTKEQIWDEVKRCMDIGKSCPGYIMAVGNHIPANVPVENCLTYEAAYEALSRR